jgi:hypothetical protein
MVGFFYNVCGYYPQMKFPIKIKKSKKYKKKKTNEYLYYNNNKL